PENIEERVHEVIRKYTDRNIAYLYDSMSRNPADHILHYFDTVFSFDDEDVKKYGFKKITNYNYLEYCPAEKQNPKLDLFYITSYDTGRLERLNSLINQIQSLNIKFRAVIAGKKGWKNQITQIIDQKNINILNFRRTNIPQQSLPKLYKNTKVILDLQRQNQMGLSFRIFEAMALEKKFITDNQNIKNYDFYNPKNILVLKEDFSNIEKSFFETGYQKLSDEIYYKYTIDNWVNTVFNLS
ncbi:MAG TPA: hypothetical protein VF455_11365, partial [Chryseobacterium sp.]